MFRILKVSKGYCYYYFVIYFILSKFFKVDLWHSSGNFYCRQYKGRIVDFLNERNFSSVVECGCGLGEIISRVNAPVKYGVDIDPNVIRMAKFLNSKDTFYEAGDFRSVIPLNFDVFIAVNWLHSITPDSVKELFGHISGRARFVLLDKIDKNADPCYQFKHDFAFLYKEARLVEEFRVPGEPRTFCLFEF